MSASDATAGSLNEVRLIGRLSAAPEPRQLPSGDQLIQTRVVVDRPENARSRQRVDALDCTVWSASVRRQVARWSVGDVVELHGSVRRRFFQTPGGAQSRVEIEVHRARRLQRASQA